MKKLLITVLAVVLTTIAYAQQSDTLGYKPTIKYKYEYYETINSLNMLNKYEESVFVDVYLRVNGYDWKLLKSYTLTSGESIRIITEKTHDSYGYNVVGHSRITKPFSSASIIISPHSVF